MTAIRLIYSILLVSLFTFSCANSHEENESKDDIIERMSFIYDINCIDFDKLPRIDTLCRHRIENQEKREPVFIYLVTGDCSICVSKAINFIKAFQSREKFKQKSLILISKGGDEIIRYYIEKENLENYIEYISVSEDVKAEDGVYFVMNNRILNYEYWSI